MQKVIMVVDKRERFTVENIAKIEGLKVFRPIIRNDDRGYFFESFNLRYFQNPYDFNNTDTKTKGIDPTIKFIQDNESCSKKGVIRALHYQTGKLAQSKLVRVISGAVLDVAVDLRPNSSSYGEWYSIYLSAKNKIQFFVPKGFAHGFIALEDNTIFQYKVDEYYSKEHEGGILYNDPTLNIDWECEKYGIDKPFLNEKDLDLSLFGQHKY